MKKNEDDTAEIFARVDQLSRSNAPIDKAVSYLNAEFYSCFWAVKNTLWMSWMEGTQEQRRAIGTFSPT